SGPACNSNVSPHCVIHGATMLPVLPPATSAGGPLPARTYTLGLVAPDDVQVTLVVHVPALLRTQGFGFAEIEPVGLLSGVAVTVTAASSGSANDGPECNSNVLPKIVTHGTTAVPDFPPPNRTGVPLPTRT